MGDIILYGIMIYRVMVYSMVCHDNVFNVRMSMWIYYSIESGSVWFYSIEGGQGDESWYVQNHGMYRVMVVGIWIYSMVCDVREYQGESDGI